ncbi:hypothetical protein T484DRAFT_1758309, partial [Baffinella frigidus]
MTHTPPHEFFMGDAEMRLSSATLSEFAFEMEMEGAEPIVPEPALQQRTEAPSTHSSSLLTSWTTSPISAPAMFVLPARRATPPRPARRGQARVRSRSAAGRPKRARASRPLDPGPSEPPVSFPGRPCARESEE